LSKVGDFLAGVLKGERKLGCVKGKRKERRDPAENSKELMAEIARSCCALENGFGSLVAE